MGSRILSRSFTVSRWPGEDEVEATAAEQDAANSAAMDVDDQKPSDPANEANAMEPTDNSGEDDDSEDGAEDPSDVAMVPMADMLNARFESENVGERGAKLFYEEHVLNMTTTKEIKAGEQIWNTYGDPPNSDLLRRYGHVDLVPLRPPLTGNGNPEDIVEVRADLVVGVASKRMTVDAGERVDWWLENEEDDTFVIGTECEPPKDFVSFTRLMLQSQPEWEKTRAKDKVPKAILDADVISVVIEVLQQRLSEYPTTLEDDEVLLAKGDLTGRKRSAVIVRLGEKRILNGTIGELRKSLEALHNVNRDKNKRKAHHRSDTASGSGSKKARR
ncbi:hypothetical protein EIP86_008764 [Pleurotus ostreatoroseus]|nr:hypothetical protein EIP86_008764 [Pleurotus ostreatoroseus]